MHKQQPWQETNPVKLTSDARFRAPRQGAVRANTSSQLSVTQHLSRRKRVDQSALSNVADGNELVRPMGDRQQSRSVGERGYAASRIESCFEQTWAHLKGGVPFRSRCQCAVTELCRADLLLELLPPVPLEGPRSRNLPAHRVGGAFLLPSLLRDLDGGRS